MSSYKDGLTRTDRLEALTRKKNRGQPTFWDVSHNFAPQIVTSACLLSFPLEDVAPLGLYVA